MASRISRISRISRSALLLCLACWTGGVQAGGVAVVRTETQFKAVLASSQPTPLDALTPYGKRTLLRSIRWSEDGAFRGFSYRSIVRELDARQLADVLAFFDSAADMHYYRDELVGTPLRLPEPSSGIEQRLLDFERISDEMAGQHHAAAAGASTARMPTAQLQHYKGLFGDRMDATALRRQPLGDLLPLFDAAARMEFDHPGSALPDLLLVHHELVERGVDTRRMLDGEVLRALIAAREFDQARSFAAARPHLGEDRIPKLNDALGKEFKGRSLYRYDKASHTLTREAAPVPKGTQLVMVVSGGCRFSADALDAIRSDPGLLERLRRANLLILTQPGSTIPFRFLGQWNASNPTLPVRVPATLDEWRSVDTQKVPEFFLFRDGKQVGHLSGWPEGGNKAAVLALLDTAHQ